MKIDLHCHSKYSYDTYLEPESVIEEAVLKGLDGVCFTEHHSIAESLPVDRIRAPENFYIFRGIEISTSCGHLLIYGLKDDTWNLWSRNHYLEVEPVIRVVHQLGGICVPAHPFRGYDSFGKAVYQLSGLDAIETHNGLNSSCQNSKALEAARSLGLPSIGGSDCHTRDRVGAAYTKFENPVRCIEELVEEVKKGNCKGVLSCSVISSEDTVF